MVETKIVLCDVCKDRVAKNKCMICGADICNNPECKRDIVVTIEGDSKAILRLNYCQKHGSILKRRMGEDFLNKEIKDVIIKELNNYFMKKLTAQGLKEQDKKMRGI